MNDDEMAGVYDRLAQVEQLLTDALFHLRMHGWTAEPKRDDLCATVATAARLLKRELDDLHRSLTQEAQ
jgi:hypothetical protein